MLPLTCATPVSQRSCDAPPALADAQPAPDTECLGGPIHLDMIAPKAIAARGIGIRCYTAPNEWVPARMLPLTRQAPRGSYVGVGAERCFIAAALNPQLERIVMADYDPRVVLYNSVNIALLQGAADRAAYLDLRLRGSAADLSAAATRGSRLGAASGSHRFDMPTLRWWIQQVRQKPSMVAFNEPPKPYRFADANYLHDDGLYARVATRARQGRLQAMLLNFADDAQVGALVAYLKREGDTVAVLDISNAWQRCYMGPTVWTRLGPLFAPVFSEDSLLLGTANAWVDPFLHPGGALSGEFWGFTYFATRYGACCTATDQAALASWLERLDTASRAETLSGSTVERMDAHLTPCEDRALSVRGADVV